MKRDNRSDTIFVIFIFAITLLFLAACGSNAIDETESDSEEVLSTKTGILIEASMNLVVIQAPDGSTYTFGIDEDTHIEGSEYLGNTLSVSFYGEYAPGIIAVAIRTIVEVDHASSPDKGNIDEPDAPQPKEPSSSDETIWYMTGTVMEISATGLQLLYEDGKTYTVVIDENTKKDPGIVEGCVARVFRKGSLRDGMLAIEIHFISASPDSFPTPTPAPPLADDSNVAPGDIIEHAKSLVGVPYSSGGASIDAGFDNSGFIFYVLNRNGVNCPRTIREQVSIGQQVTDFADLQASDLVFFSDGSGSRTAQYGGIYIGDGTMIYSSYAGKGVTQRDISQQWYKDAFVLGVRIR